MSKNANINISPEIRNIFFLKIREGGVNSRLKLFQKFNRFGNRCLPLVVSLACFSTRKKPLKFPPTTLPHIRKGLLKSPKICLAVLWPFKLYTFPKRLVLKRIVAALFFIHWYLLRHTHTHWIWIHIYFLKTLELCKICWAIVLSLLSLGRLK